MFYIIEFKDFDQAVPVTWRSNDIKSLRNDLKRKIGVKYNDVDKLEAELKANNDVVYIFNSKNAARNKWFDIDESENLITYNSILGHGHDTVLKNTLNKMLSVSGFWAPDRY